jgi:hypothetical protein
MTEISKFGYSHYQIEIKNLKTLVDLTNVKKKA